MDGFETPASVRRREAVTGRRLPIIVPTAYAIQGDRELCLSSGMDVYVSKLLQSRERLRTIDEAQSTEPENGWRCADRLEICSATP